MPQPCAFTWAKQIEHMVEKEHIIRFLKERKRGVYALIVSKYRDVISDMGVAMALQIIKDDLEKEAGTTVRINYFSLAKAVSKTESRTTKKAITTSTRKWEFKDAYEMKESQTTPGKFKLGQTH